MLSIKIIIYSKLFINIYYGGKLENYYLNGGHANYTNLKFK